MKGFVSVIIPTKSYIKAYVINQLGDWPKMTTRHEIGNKLYDLLAHKTNERKTEFSNKRYNATIKLFISIHTYRQRGCCLNETNIKNFNLFLEKKIMGYLVFLKNIIFMFSLIKKSINMIYLCFLKLLQFVI